MILARSQALLKNQKIPSVLLGIFAFALLLSSQIYKNQQPQTRSAFIAPPAQIEHFTFGYREIVADLFWIRSIQDFDYCEKTLSKHLCVGQSWLYKMLDTITDLSPKFRMPYATGALALTVIVSDYEGATKLFDKGVKAFPNDWRILYRAAYHYLYEVKDNARAAELMKAAADNGAPPWLYSLAGRLYSDAGNTELAEALLEEMIATGQDPQLIERLRSKLNSLQKSAR